MRVLYDIPVECTVTLNPKPSFREGCLGSRHKRLEGWKQFDLAY